MGGGGRLGAKGDGLLRMIASVLTKGRMYTNNWSRWSPAHRTVKGSRMSVSLLVPAPSQQCRLPSPQPVRPTTQPHPAPRLQSPAVTAPFLELPRGNTVSRCGTSVSIWTQSNQYKQCIAVHSQRDTREKHSLPGPQPAMYATARHGARVGGGFVVRIADCRAGHSSPRLAG